MASQRPYPDLELRRFGRARTIVDFSGRKLFFHLYSSGFWGAGHQFRWLSECHDVEALEGKTPSEACGIEVKGDNNWITLIQNACKNRINL